MAVRRTLCREGRAGDERESSSKTMILNNVNCFWTEENVGN